MPRSRRFYEHAAPRKQKTQGQEVCGLDLARGLAQWLLGPALVFLWKHLRHSVSLDEEGLVPNFKFFNGRSPALQSDNSLFYTLPTKKSLVEEKGAGVKKKNVDARLRHFTLESSIECTDLRSDSSSFGTGEMWAQTVAQEGFDVLPDAPVLAAKRTRREICLWVFSSLRTETASPRP